MLFRSRLRLGVGLGWNAVEYEALGQDFSTRGRRLEEQVPLLRRLWTERSVTHRGRFEHISGAGIAPLPVQRPIPVWFGAASPPAFEATRDMSRNRTGSASAFSSGATCSACSLDRAPLASGAQHAVVPPRSSSTRGFDIHLY